VCVISHASEERVRLASVFNAVMDVAPRPSFSVFNDRSGSPFEISVAPYPTSLVTLETYPVCDLLFFSP